MIRDDLVSLRIFSDHWGYLGLNGGSLGMIGTHLGMIGDDWGSLEIIWTHWG